MSLFTRVVCFLALGRPDLEDHWKSLQSGQAFEIVRTKLCSILASTITTAGVLLTMSGVFVTTGFPVPCFDHTSPAPHCLLFISLMLAMIALLTSGSSLIRWLYTDRRWTQEQLKLGGYFVLSYLLSIVTPHVLHRLVPTLFHFCDVDSRVFISKYDLPRSDCALASHIRRQHWDDIDGNYVEVCDKP
ncbi:hypothetical protein DFJ58DRAFT_763271 [Suillus subalutaceus]|uniref:uncharacterized protein n=1 Tax=Suillus subalutaceus TaxID=48586 RepID=UPI001B884991|nr:uncharacterized protein DFJ58DRAFT_763271 [Suillus subalutaceus]KAG1871306.1 hypothetical protein DFJ58DRAFT_763271 [Suillus subalutaceus]